MNKVLEAKTDNVTMNYFRFGNSEAKKVIIVPGLSLKSVMNYKDSIIKQYDLLAKNYDVYVMDQKKDIEEGYDVHMMADNLYEVLRSINIDKATLVGSSLGGMIAQDLAINHSDFVKGLVLASTCSDCTDNNEALNEWLKYCDNKDLRGLIDSFCKKVYTPKIYNAIIDNMLAMADDTSDEELDRFVKCGKAARSFNAGDRLNEIKCPVLVIAGKKDEIFDYHNSEIIADTLGCDIYLYEEYGHACYDEAIDYVGKVKNFIDSKV